MIKINSFADILSKGFNLPGKIVIDVGCGTGDLVRWLTLQGALVTGVDIPKMLARAEKMERVKNEKYIAGTAQELPFEKEYADLIFYIASFHHIPENEMSNSLERCFNILKPSGKAIFVEPVAKIGSYYEIGRLIEEESEIQITAYQAIKESIRFGFQMKTEKTYYVERSFDDYKNLAEIFVDDEIKRKEIIFNAEKYTRQLCRELGKNIESYKYRSICRLNILEKPC